MFSDAIGKMVRLNGAIHGIFNQRFDPFGRKAAQELRHALSFRRSIVKMMNRENASDFHPQPRSGPLYSR
jgi:hypothetical protein